MNSKKVIHVTKTEFELEDGTIHPHAVEEETLPKTYEAELIEDMLSLMASFSAKIYGKRSTERRKKQ
jgi:predicted site-specific integrase-resolvase